MLAFEKKPEFRTSPMCVVLPVARMRWSDLPATLATLAPPSKTLLLPLIEDKEKKCNLAFNKNGKEKNRLARTDKSKQWDGSAQRTGLSAGNTYDYFRLKNKQVRETIGIKKGPRADVKNSSGVAVQVVFIASQFSVILCTAHIVLRFPILL